MGDDPTREVTVLSLPPDEAGRRSAAMLLARAAGLALSDARLLLERLPVRIPRVLDTREALGLSDGIAALGGQARAEPTRTGARTPCGAHPTLLAEQRCERCDTSICTVCALRSGPSSLCSRCAAKRSRSKRFTRVRVAVLLMALVLVGMVAWRDLRSRQVRTDWERALVVALVVVRDGDVADDVIGALEARVPDLQERLQQELARYRPAAFAPITFVPRRLGALPKPVPRPPGTGYWDLAGFNYQLWRFARAIDAGAGVDSSTVDARIYLVVRRPRDQAHPWVEGLGQEGGRIGIVEVEINSSMVDFALFVATHELMHTLGASEKYDAAGHVLVPSGLADPDQEPRYPQQRAELMARFRAVSESSEVPPESLDELAIGPTTAREIGWLR